MRKPGGAHRWRMSFTVLGAVVVALGSFWLLEVMNKNAQDITASKHLNDINNLKANAADLGGPLGGKIIDFVDNQITPIIKQAEKAGLLLKSEVSRLPAALRERNGSLVFENGSIKLEQVE